MPTLFKSSDFLIWQDFTRLFRHILDLIDIYRSTFDWGSVFKSVDSDPKEPGHPKLLATDVSTR